jgi:hypothetical protein
MLSQICYILLPIGGSLSPMLAVFSYPYRHSFEELPSFQTATAEISAKQGLLV